VAPFCVPHIHALFVDTPSFMSTQSISVFGLSITFPAALYKPPRSPLCGKCTGVHMSLIILSLLIDFEKRLLSFLEPITALLWYF